MWIEEFMGCIETFTFAKSGLEDALAVKDAHLPTKLYKYRRYDEYARANLETDTIWMASPDTYNDPYDCSFRVTEAHVVDVFKKSMVPEFARIYKLPPDVADEQIKNAMSSPEPLAYLADYMHAIHGATPGSNPLQAAEFVSLKVPSIIKDIVEFVRQWRKVTKVCSFSAVNDSILMWGHYAQDHKGFCVEYDLEKLPPEHTLRCQLFPVIYSPKLYDLTAFMQKLAGPNQAEVTPASLLLAVLHKFDGWSYEQEWRVVSLANKVIGDYNLPVPTPTRIFIGSKMSPENGEALRKICEQKHIEVFQMELAPDRFQLLPRPN